MYRSTNDGITWFKIDSGYTNYPTRCIPVTYNDFIFAVTDPGMLCSFDNCNIWMNRNNHLVSSQISSVIFDNLSGYLFAGTTGISSLGIFRSTDNGEVWNEDNTGITATEIKDFAINSNGDIFAATIGYGIFRSTNKGDYWVEVNNGLTDYTIYALVINELGYIFAATNYGVNMSSDNGENWINVSNGLDYHTVFDLAINEIGNIFAASQYGVYKSTAMAKIERSNSDISSFHVFSIIVNFKGNFAGSDGNNGGVFRSTNNGNNWTKINSGLTDVSIPTLRVIDWGIFLQEQIFVSLDLQITALIGLFL